MRRARDGEDADGAVDALHERRDHRRVDDARDEDAVGARLEIGAAALDGTLEPGGRVADLAEEDVGAGVEDERDAGLLADRAHGGDLGAERARSGAASSPPSRQVLQVEPDRPDLDDPARGGRGGLGLVAVAGLHVGGHGQVDGAGDRARPRRASARASGAARRRIRARWRRRRSRSRSRVRRRGRSRPRSRRPTR